MAESRYYKQSVEILLERDGDLFRQIDALAEKTGKSIEELLEWAVGIGVEEHLKRTVRVLR